MRISTTCSARSWATSRPVVPDGAEAIGGRRVSWTCPRVGYGSKADINNATSMEPNARPQ